MYSNLNIEKNLGPPIDLVTTSTSVIVFLAIMLHKAPAAFGLTTFLLHEGLEKHRVRRHLMTFVRTIVNEMYRVTLVVKYLGWVDLDMECSTIQLG